MSLTCEICIFCYRDSSLYCSNNVNDNEELGNRITLNRFVKLAERWLKTNLPLHDTVAEHGNGIFGTCEDCKFVVDSFCKLYHEWKCLELEVEWRLQKLCSVMKCADRVSSRKQRLDSKFNSSEEGRRLIEWVTTFRAELQQKYRQRCSKSFPRVSLKSVSNNLTVSPKLEANYAEPQSLMETNDESLYLGWISSFAAVLLLCNWSQESTENYGDPTQMVVSDDDVVSQQLKEEIGICIVSTCDVASVPQSADLDLQLETEPDYSVNQNMSPDTPDNEGKQDKSESRTFDSSVLPSSSQKVKTQSKKRKRLQSSLTNPNKKLRRREPNVNAGVFKCFLCHRNFTSFSHLQRHRRAFTHLFTLMKHKIPVKLDDFRRKKSKLEPNNKTSVDNTNFGILRPLRRVCKPKVDTDATDTQSETDPKTEKIPATEAEIDSFEFEASSSTDSESSSTSSEELSSKSSDSSLTATNYKIRKRRQKVNRIEQYQHPFVCNVDSCPKSFEFEEELELHKKYHGCFPCSVCNKTSKYAPDLSRHELLHAKRNIAGNNKRRPYYRKEYHCWRCNYVVSGGSGRYNFIDHHLTKHLNLPAQKTMCKICKAWLRIKSVKTHMNSCHKESESLHKCDQCAAHFDKEHQLHQHKKKGHATMKNGTLNSCEPCRKAFTTEQELKAHKVLHGSFPCKFCHIMKEYAPDLVHHEVVQCKSRPKNEKHCKKFNCARCKVGTNDMYSCVNHYVSRHLLKKRCAICQKNVRAGTQEEIHFRTHHDTNNVDPKDIKKCSKCSAYFLKEDQRRYHIKKSHPPPQNRCKKEFPCKMNSCSISVEFEEELENHMKQHGNFPCKYCSVVKTYAPNLAVHELSHSQRKESSDKTWQCPRCEFQCRYKSKSQYVTHFITRHLHIQSQLIICRICRKSIGKSNFHGHNRVYHRTEGLDPKLIQKCEQCPAYFIQKYQLTDHIKQIHNLKEFGTIQSATICPSNLLCCVGKQKCSRTFETAEQLENHRKLHGTFPCSTCDKVLTYAPKLALHEIVHTPLPPGEFGTCVRPIRTLKCPKCEIVPGSKIRYINHYLVTHMGLPQDGVKCTNCTESFEKPKELARHMSRYHNFESAGVIAKCDKCAATFGNKFYVVLHKQRVHGEDSLTCVDCGKKLGTPTSLKQHRMKKHNKQEADFPLACDVLGCERRFENEIRLVWHKHNWHEGNGKIIPLICHECGMKCSSKAVFNNHMLLHSPEKRKLMKEPKRYVCEECGKVFNAQIKLEIHQFSHSGPESWKYSCIFCGKKSATEWLHMEHIKAHTDEKPYICDICGEEYALGRNLRDHKNKKHNANELPRIKRVVNWCVSKKGQKVKRLRK
ncbi:unnamed protein product [Orchesella dallaii]|uniref:C2H2-type domain-containing protein n=1 Tax=Orchesella dallaii TaxID=48710 RepID=A0ABP1RLA0_9HEXA